MPTSSREDFVNGLLCRDAISGIGFGSGTNLSGGDALNMLYRAVELPTMSEARQLGSLHYDYNDGARWVRKICDDEAQAVANSAAPVMSILQTSPHLLPWPQASLVLNGDAGRDSGFRRPRHGSGPAAEIARDRGAL